ncbi:MAG: HDIG domain-containing metalloprotein [Planctomycetaceae bacterium]
MRSVPPASSRVDDLLRNQSLLLRWLIAIAAVVSLTLLVEAWRPPFPYRQGDYVADGIAARIPFQKIDEYRTERARDDKEEEVLPIFRLDSGLIDRLPGQLRENLEEVARSESLDMLSEQTRIDFGLVTADGAGGGDAVSLRGDYEALAASVRAKPGSDEDRVDAIAKAFESVVAELKANGVITADELKLNEIPADGSIAILRPGETKPQEVSIDAVLLAKIVAPEGRIGRLLEQNPELTKISRLLRRWLQRKAIVTLRYDSAATQDARQDARLSVGPQYNSYNPRDFVVAPGTKIDEPSLETLRARHEQSRLKPGRTVARALTVFAMIGVLATLNAYYFHRNERQLLESPARLAVYAAAVVLAVGIGRFLSYDPWRAEVIPIIAVVMVVAIAYDQLLATITAFTLSALIVLTTTGDLGHFVTLMAVSAAVIIPISVVDSRSKLIKVGFLAAAVYFVMSLGWSVLERPQLDDLWTDTALWKRSFFGAFWCLVASYLVAGSLPFIESLFGVVTDISLLEMTDVSHPLLQELVRRAPGTYNHSMSVATIGETAADAIGANGLLVRVGAYFHDVGKMLKPHYFVENMTEGQKSRHEQLAPAMSTLIIIGHVRDGVDLAREHNLPRRVVDFIEQHHGTTLVEYFYREATRLADQTPDHKSDAEESAFRYPGPKPQTKEVGVIMLADAVESASRTLSEPTPKRIESLVRGIALKRLLDGQFDECGLSLNEIRVVEDSLIKSLIGIYHGRIKYPDQKIA